MGDLNIQQTEEDWDQLAEELVQDDTKPRGNTKHTLGLKGRHWCWTFNGYTQNDVVQMEKWCAKQCEQWTFQEETGKTGNKHLQGYWSFKNPRTDGALYNAWPKMHIERCKYKECCVVYAQKDETRTGKEFGNIDKLEDPLKDTELKPWQKELIETVQGKADRRVVHWYYSMAGATGKSSTAFHIVMKYDGIKCVGKASDIKYAVSDYIKRKKKMCKIVIIDIPRNQYEDKVPYTAIEEIKDGCFFSGKYESGMVLQNSPHVIVFANYPPNTTKLSMDRWHIVDVTPEDEKKKADIWD